MEEYIFALSAKDGKGFGSPSDNLPPGFELTFSGIEFLGEFPGRLTTGAIERRYLAHESSYRLTNRDHKLLQAAAETNELHFSLHKLLSL